MRRLAVVLVALGFGASASANPLTEHDFILNCAGCHTQAGVGSATVPSLLAMTEVVSQPNARAYLIRVPGVAQAPLTDARLAALMNWLVTRFTGSAPSPAYTAAEVKKLRSDPLLDPLDARRRLLGAPRP